MKKTIKPYILAALLFVAAPWLTASCSFLETDESGDLGGFWHMERIDDLTTDEQTDLTGARQFWSVQGTILEVSTRNDGIVEPYIFSYEHSGSSLKLSDPRKNDREQGDPAVESVEVLRKYGINELTETFTIEALDHSKMQLRSNTVRIYFTKM